MVHISFPLFLPYVFRSPIPDSHLYCHIQQVAKFLYDVFLRNGNLRKFLDKRTGTYCKK
jgi:hypothetical protein